jgi:hypothetical protein
MSENINNREYRKNVIKEVIKELQNFSKVKGGPCVPTPLFFTLLISHRTGSLACGLT